MYLYGKSFTHNFFILANNEYISLANAELNSAYIYFDKPSKEDARSGAGSPIQEITEWETASTVGKALTIAAIDDPDINGSEMSRMYYLVINFTLEETEQMQTVIQGIVLSKPLSQISKVGAVASDLKKVFPELDSFVAAADQLNMISVAEESTKLDLQVKGFEWALIYDPVQLKLAVVYKALEQIMLSLIVSAGDQWSERYNSYKDFYLKILSEVKIKYDTDKDGVPNVENRAINFIRAIR